MLLLNCVELVVFALGVAFLCVALLTLSRFRKDAVFLGASAYFATFGLLLIAIGLWDALVMASSVDLAHLLCFTLGAALVPLGSYLIAKCLCGDEAPWRLLSTIFVVSCGGEAANVAGLILHVISNVYYMVDFSLAALAYGAVVAAGYRGLGPFRSLPSQLKVFFAFSCLTIMLSTSMVVFESFAMKDLLMVLLVFLIAIFSAMAFMVYGHPGAFSFLSSQARSIRYSRSTLKGVDVASRQAELGRAMRVEELFRDEDLSLERLAARLSLSAHQLSELLNHHVGLSFPVYVLGFRIERAKQELAELPERAIIDIAYSCGFKSKSAFNEAFRKATGLTPSAYRRASGSSTRIRGSGL